MLIKVPSDCAQAHELWTAAYRSLVWMLLVQSRSCRGRIKTFVGSLDHAQYSFSFHVCELIVSLTLHLGFGHDFSWPM